MTKVPSLKEMLDAGMHFGHSKSKWNPKMEPYIFTSRNGVHIIDLTKSQEKLEVALEFIANLANEKKQVLFVGTKKQAKAKIAEIASEINMPYVNEKWPGGALTNFGVFRRSIKKYNDLLAEKAQGKLDKYTKWERVVFERQIEKLEKKVKGLTNLNKLPDALFVWDVKKEKIAILEAKKKNIPIIAVCDTNVDPNSVNYPIPANDDALKTIELILNSVKNAVEEGQKNESKKSE
jgi:small subunit ribosomal protein S2